MACGNLACVSSARGSESRPHPQKRAVPANHETAAARVIRLLARLRNAMGRLGLMVVKARQRRVLRELDERLLSDIGKTREDALREAEKHFWQ